MYLQKIAEYIADRLEMAVGEDVFYFEFPDQPDVCVAAVEVPTQAFGTVSQIPASMHKVKFYVRHGSNTEAYELAAKCYRALRGDLWPGHPVEQEIWNWDHDGTKPDQYFDETDHTGFLRMLDDSFLYVFLRGEPVWEKMDQQKRKIFAFEAIITSEKL